MKRVLINFQRSIEAVIGRVQRRFQRARSGTILIMVVALLVLLALMGTAFIATARLDRLTSGELKQLTSWQEIADGLAQQALSTASSWIVADPQTFTSHTVDNTAGTAAAGTSYVAARDPAIYGPGNDTLMSAAAAQFAQPPTNAKAGAAFIAWPHITQPLGYNYFVSPIVPANLAPSYSANPNPNGAPQNAYDLGPLKYLMVPSNVVISYPVGYPFNADLAGRTWTFPAFYRLSQGTGSTTATPSWTVDGPFLAADATGWGIADAGLVPLNMPPTNGISWFAAWRIVDDAAAVNVNTAFTPSLDQDANNNCQNYFPDDVDLVGLLSTEFNGTDPSTAKFGEFLSINARRYARYNTTAFTAANTYPAVDDANVSHTDMQYSNDAEIIWSNLGRRLDYPANFTNGPVQAGDPLKQYQRPFDESDTVALGYRGVMAQTDGPASKFEQVEASTTANPAGDSIYRSAVNYMANTNNQFKFFEPNQVAYWYDWNFNYDFPYDFSTTYPHSTAGAGGLRIFNGPSSVSALSTLTIGNSLGTVANTNNNYPYRPPRADVGASSRIMNQVRMVDYPTLSALASATGTAALTAIQPTSIMHKASLNTGLFGELWRAYINALNDFPSEDGTTANKSATNYYPLKVPGGPIPNGPPGDGYNACNAGQFRSVLRDPLHDSSVSAAGTCAQNFSPYALPGNIMMVLRGALGAANIMTLRDQHGSPMGSGYFMPKSFRQAITLTPTTMPAGVTSYNAVTYGVGVQPYITEVYVSTDNFPHPEQVPSNAQNQNLEGLVVIKLYNPFPFAIPLTNYGFALVDRSGFPQMNVQMMDPGTSNLSAQSIAANSYLVLSNFNPTTGWWPAYLGAAPKTADKTYLEIDNLTQVIGGLGTGSTSTGFSGGKSYELVLLAPADPSSAAGTGPEVPVDSFDFSGLVIGAYTPGGNTQVAAWHYLRMSGDLPPDPANPQGNTNWKCVFPGPYSGSGTFGAASLPTTRPATPASSSSVLPHYECETDGPWAASMPAMEPWVIKAPVDFHLDYSANIRNCDSTTTTYTELTYPNKTPYPGIPLCNVDFGGYNKFGSTPNTSSFPFGGFARVGDAVQAPFIGSYVLLPVVSGNPNANVWPPSPTAAGQPATPTIVTEVNPVTVDTCFADDGDVNDDKQEQIGRCVPVLLNSTGNPAISIDDYSMSGAYTPTSTSQSSSTFQNILPAQWRYHFGLELFNQFTAVSNPESDYLPNIEPGSWKGTVVPYPVSNTTATKFGSTTPANSGNEDGVGVEGPINVNTASWRVLAALELIPRSQDPQGVLNEHLAQAIVHYRDVDDGVTRYSAVTLSGQTVTTAPGATVLPPRGHGPFNSLLELNQVFDYTAGPTGTTPNLRRIYANTFQNAFGTLPANLSTEAMRHQWGYYTPGPSQTATGNLQIDDWVPQYLMVNRVSNLLTTRSDTFTVYVVVQGWRNVTTANSTAAAGTLPELVVQRRMAMTVNRCGIVHNSGTPATVQLTTK